MSLGVGVPFNFNKLGGGGAAPSSPDFISTWDTTQAGSASDTIVLPMTAGSTVDWGDGTVNNLNTHTYAVGGIYTVKILTTAALRFFSAGDRLKITEISNWGVVQLIDHAYYGCSNLVITATDTPTVVGSSLRRCFRDAQSITALSLNGVDVSGVTNFLDCFYRIGFGTEAALEIDQWQLTQATNLSGFCQNTKIATANYDTLLISLDAQGAFTWSGTLNMGTSQFTLGGAAEAARTSLISKWGGITDGGGI